MFWLLHLAVICSADQKEQIYAIWKKKKKGKAIISFAKGVCEQTNGLQEQSLQGAKEQIHCQGKAMKANSALTWNSQLQNWKEIWGFYKWLL